MYFQVKNGSTTDSTTSACMDVRGCTLDMRVPQPNLREPPGAGDLPLLRRLRRPGATGHQPRPSARAVSVIQKSVLVCR